MNLETEIRINFKPTKYTLMKIKLIIISLLLISLTSAKKITEEIDLGISAYVDGGRFQLDKPENTRKGEFLTRSGARWSVIGNFSENFTAFANLHWLWWRNMATDLGLFHIVGAKFNSEGEAFFEYRLSDYFRSKCGIMKIKYNPDSRNLGEYILRSEAYPIFIESSTGADLLDTSHAKVLGLEYKLDYGMLYQRGLVFFEQTNVPTNDMSFAFFTGINPFVFELGLGIAAKRYIKTGNKVNNKLLTDTLKSYIKDQALSASAVNAAFTAKVDIKRLFKLPFEEKFQVYTEIGVLGMKRDSRIYDTWIKHIPIMFGFDLPTGGLFSDFGLEFEYFRNPFYDKKYPLADGGGNKYSPLPSVIADTEYEEGEIPRYHRDDWKWSLFISKSLNKQLDLKVRAANDHLRLLEWDSDIANGGRPVTFKPKDWYFLVRVEWHN